MSKDGRQVKTDQGEAAELNALQAAISTDRLAPYLAACGGDRKMAMQLYRWNVAVSAGFYGPLQTVEVTLRNSLHNALSDQYGVTWYDALSGDLDTRANVNIDESKRGLLRQGHPVDPPHMVANLSFGFWVALLGAGGRRASPNRKANYEMTLWRPALRHAFPGAAGQGLNRKKAHRPFEYMRLLRNRIAHHEPIHRRRLDKDYDSLLQTLTWMSPAARRWVETSSRVPELLATDWRTHDIRF
ncbi:hypothetical protein [Parvularcula oceani]|uniref:hypothetical protein n=1 Tax=Parvularcula oceani TaxID=1247963 RepID=UPI0004E102AF|nr:hypothetical protein [Parvularcula oceani]